MAKEFKDFDKKYGHLKGTALKKLVEERIISAVYRSLIDQQVRWHYAGAFFEGYSREDIHNAVYVGNDADYWQQYRVGMKGLSTREKLYVCAILWGVYIDDDNNSMELRRVWRIRINNYIGALKRGGQLDSELRVIKER